MRTAFLLVSLALLQTGCGPGATPPTISLRDVAIDSFNASGVDLRFNTDIENPNDFPLPVSSAGYNLQLGGVTVVDGTFEPETAIPASGKAPVAIPIAITFRQLMLAENALIESKGNIPYQLTGAIDFPSGPLKALGVGLRVPLKFSGTLPLRDAIDNPVEFLKTPEGRKFVEAVLGRSKLGDWLGR